MKIYKLPQLAEHEPGGQYYLGPENLNTSSVYLLYGRLKPKETDRKFAPEHGREEIIYVIKGHLTVRQGKKHFSVSSGEAFYSCDPFQLDNTSDFEAVYLAAGAQPLAEKTAPGAPADTVKGGAGKPDAPPPAAEKDEDDEFEITRDDGLKENEE